MLSVLDINGSAGTNYLTASKDDNNVLTIEIMNKNVSYIRVCGNGIVPNNMRVSINKEL